MCVSSDRHHLNNSNAIGLTPDLKIQKDTICFQRTWRQKSEKYVSYGHSFTSIYVALRVKVGLIYVLKMKDIGQGKL